MKYEQLNKDWGAEPNSPDPEIEINYNSRTLTLHFYLNAFMYENVEEEDRGVLEFHNCYLFRLGPTNDEGFYKGDCRFSRSGISWGEFYKLEESGWESDFPSDKVMIASVDEISKLNHYLFYFRDETFECIAEGFDFKALQVNS
ncbi:hypothetical protein [Cohnella candidum]|uniref:hypothetical protein n=1 Tax=Cohnella candidum TaxID=2674991 RepID=UPI0013DE1C14|nr:hypothetical protein [Cohnella candidum]